MPQDDELELGFPCDTYHQHNWESQCNKWRKQIGKWNIFLKFRNSIKESFLDKFGISRKDSGEIYLTSYGQNTFV